MIEMLIHPHIVSRNLQIKPALTRSTSIHRRSFGLWQSSVSTIGLDENMTLDTSNNGEVSL